VHVALRVTLAWLAVSTFVSSAYSDEESQRRYSLSRGDENWAWLRNPHATSDFFDPIKYLRLAKRREDLFLSIGGETRQYLEFFQNELWGSTGHVDNVSWLQRYMLHAELRLTRYVRLFVQLKSGIEVGRLGGPGPVDEDLLDANQAFVDVDAVPGRTLDDLPHLTLRIGRQELSYGSGRLIDVRDGPVNVRFSYDGFRIISRFSVMRVDAFLVRPDLTRPGVFDDGWDTTQGLWGIWATLNVPRVLVDAYYLGLDRQHAVYEKGMGHDCCDEPREIRLDTSARSSSRT
jgi:Alginate export